MGMDDRGLAISWSTIQCEPLEGLNVTFGLQPEFMPVWRSANVDEDLQMTFHVMISHDPCHSDPRLCGACESQPIGGRRTAGTDRLLS